MPGKRHHVQGGRCHLSPLTKVRCHPPFLHGCRNTIWHSSSRSPPEPSTDPRRQQSCCSPAWSCPRVPIAAAHQHTQILGLYFRSGLPRAREPRQCFPWGFQKPSWQRSSKEERRRDRGETELTWCKSEHLKTTLTVLNDDLDEPN